MSPENDDQELCVRHRGPFNDFGLDAALLARLMGRDWPEGVRGTAICGGCLTGEEITAFRKALAAPQGPDF